MNFVQECKINMSAMKEGEIFSMYRCSNNCTECSCNRSVLQEVYKENIKHRIKVNLYNICVADQMKYSKKQTVTWYVDDLQSIHAYPKIYDTLA